MCSCLTLSALSGFPWPFALACSGGAFTGFGGITGFSAGGAGAVGVVDPDVGVVDPPDAAGCDCWAAGGGGGDGGVIFLFVGCDGGGVEGGVAGGVTRCFGVVGAARCGRPVWLRGAVLAA